MELKGSYYGVKSFKQYKNYDIEYSEILNNRLHRNKITIKMGQRGKCYIYHMHSSIIDNFSGRWYNMDVVKHDFQWDDKKHMVTYIIPMYENESITTQNIPIKIKFTKEGYNKLKKNFL